MSWDVTLNNKNGESVTVKRHTEGGIYEIGGTDLAELNITYNYAPYFNQYLAGGLRGLNGKLAEETIPCLEKAVEALGTERDRDYWVDTSGNAGYALSILLSWAQEYPDGRWEVH
jgi:hypothetical protein